MLRLAWFSTGRGEGSRGLLQTALEAIAHRYLPARIVVVFVNREPGEHEGSDRYMDLVRAQGLPLVCLSSRRFRRERGARSFEEVRRDYDRAVMDRLKDYEFDVGVLAGYMLIAGPELCRRYTLLNLHPAPPGGPAGTWQEVIWTLIARRAERAGAMVHIATEEVDRGPVVGYFTFPIREGEFAPLWQEVEGVPVEDLKARYGEDLPLFRAIRQAEMVRERPLLVETLRALALGEVRIQGQQVLDRQGRPIPGLDLGPRVDAWLAGPPWERG